MNANMPPALTEHSASDDSSSISSPPQSPQHVVSADEITVARPNRPTSALGGGVVGSPAYPPQSHNISANSAHEILPQPTTAPVKVKKPRKPRETKPAPDGQPLKEKKPRKPRENKVKTEGAPNAAPRKKQKVGDKTALAPPSDVTAGPRQSTLIGQFYQPGQPASAPQPFQAHPSTLAPSPRQQPPFTSDSMSRSNITPQPPSQSPAPAPASRPYSSGQNYDPIRGATYEYAPSRPAAIVNGAQSAQASPQVNRASASPSIQSLIDPPPTLKTNTSNMTYVQQANSHPVPQQTASFVNQPTSPKPTPVSTTQSLPLSPLPTQTQQVVATSMDGAMDIDAVPQDNPKQPTVKPQPQSKSSSSVPTPKPSKPTSPPAKPASKVGTGSGLLSSNNLFGGPSSETDSEPKGLTIDFQIKLNPAGGNQINIAHEIIKKYGGDAVDPHAAAHRNRLRAMALAQNKLEANSTDDMSVDLSELDNDSNVEMGGMDDERSGAGGEPVRKRRRKIEEYDKEDDFIDDRELAWEESAAVAKDGFFVYSGPLVPAGEAAQVESSAPTRGRGGGRARGRGRGGAAAAAGAPASATVARKDPNAPAVPARGRGSRGGRAAAPTGRKRATKADKEKAELEKAQRTSMLTQQQQHFPQQASGPSLPAGSPTLGMGSSTMPAPVQPQHVLHSNYGSSMPAGDTQQSGVRA